MQGSSKTPTRKFKAPISQFDGTGGLWKGKGASKRARFKRGTSGKESIYDSRTSFRKSVCASVYRELMSRCMRNIDASINQEQPAVIDQWNQFQIGKALEQREKNEEPSKKENEEEEDEEMTEEKELDIKAVAYRYILILQLPLQADAPKSSHEQKCQHDYRLNEQFGIICKLCGHVRSEIKDVSPSFLPGVVWTPSKETRAEEEAENDKQDVVDVDTRLEFVTRPASSNMFVSDDKENENDRQQGLNVLRSLTSKFIDNYEGGSAENLPGLQCYTLMMKSTTVQQDILNKLQEQRPIYKGFPLELELLITLGSIHPWLIQTTACASQYFNEDELRALDSLKFDLKLGSKVRFVMSLVPRCLLRKEKVLIFCHNIAPINLFVETFNRFYGWKKGVEVLVLQGDLELFERGRVMDKFEEPGGPSKVMLASINACAEGISLTAASRVILLDSEWNPSKSKQAIARAFRPGQDKVVYVYQLLAQGIVILDEGHNPRSTKSRLRKALMKVDTPLRVLLSGTLFQNNFGEYFNTLTLARPRFVKEVLKKLDPKTTWKEWVSSMIFSEELVEDPSHWQAPKIEDELLGEIVEEDRASLFHAIMKNEKASNTVVRGRE
nr:SNF2 domain-containing protein CLASSY 1-like [Tanacetum cinerariifolium]